MDMGALIVIVGTGALIDALADINQGKEVVVTLLAASMLLLILSALARATGQYGLASALAFLYLLASAFKNYKNVPMIQGLFGAQSHTVSQTPAASGSTTGPNFYSSNPSAGHLGIN
jgi:predicted benzoate:H+ symporter BenE